MSDNTSIVVCGMKFNIGARVVLWDEPNGLNGYDTSICVHWEENRKTGKNVKVVVSGKRYSKRSLVRPNPNIRQLQNMITQFFLHHSGLYHSKTTYEVLHEQRRLSVHFILDDDGTLYQTLDLKEKAWHGGGNNPMSIGIEIDSRASASKFPDAYDETHQKKYKVGPRRISLDSVQNMKVKGFDYSDAQYQTLIRLVIALKSIFPHIRDNLDFPRTESGLIVKSVLKKPKDHRGFICHYNTNEHKWDPVSFDYKRFLTGVFLNDPLVKSTRLDTWLDRQKALSSLGYDPGPIDGLFGPKTQKAVKEFQHDCGLTPDGKWGLQTEYMMEVTLK